MKVLVLGSGGREHALAWKLCKSPSCTEVYVAPGNAGTSKICQNIDLDPEDFENVAGFVKGNNIDLVIPGPEAPIVSGIFDYFQEAGLGKKHPVLAPGKLAAQLEGSKSAAKRFMHKYKIPTAAYSTFTSHEADEAIEFVRNHKIPLVIKADGLAAGKGVIICQDQKDAEEAVRTMLVEQKFGTASQKVIIEEFLEGEEMSAFAITDGKSIVQLPDARDYKRARENDTGPNTGGMGAISPSGMDSNFMKKVEERVIMPTLRGIEMEDWQYNGFLFFGLINVNGNPFVLEYNVRLGDPETEAILPRLEEDFGLLCIQAATNELDTRTANISNNVAATVIIASGGYPGSYKKGLPVSGLENIQESIVFHAGTKNENGNVVTSGGRVFAVTSLAGKLDQALTLSYENINKINFENKFYRKDIGHNVVLA